MLSCFRSRNYLKQKLQINNIMGLKS